jgi:hypothetical protein
MLFMMRVLGAPRDWPPSPEEELALLISRRATDLTLNRVTDENPSLDVALDELARWLADPRPYDPRHHDRPWQSMSADVRHVIATRGPRMRAATPSLSELDDVLTTPKLGGNLAARHRCSGLLPTVQSELGDAVSAAFDDLVQTVRDAAASPERLSARLRILESAIEVDGRSLRSEGRLLAGVLDNAAMDVAVAGHYLHDTPLPSVTELSNRDSAGLPAAERIALCHALLQDERPAGRQVVWLVYGNARCAESWRIELGPITFFDGPALLGAVDAVRDGNSGPRAYLPAELWSEVELSDPQHRQYTWPGDVDQWVAVRVDLGDRRLADPVRTAWEQVDALVQVAGFHGNGTSWERFSGYQVVVDGQGRGSSPFGPPRDHRLLMDHTDEQLLRLAPRLADRLPVTDPLLAELLRVSALVHDREESADPTTLLQDVRAIELVASRCDVSWQRLLTDYQAVSTVRRRTVLDVFNAVWTIAGSHELTSHVEGMPSPSELQRAIPGDHRRYELRIDVAFEALLDLARRLPTHHAASRRIRSLARHLADTDALRRWIDGSVADYQGRVNRLKRCRDALTHGGPISLDVAATVQPFANREAQAVVATALEAVLEGRTVRQFYEGLRDQQQAWREAMVSTTAVFEALTGRNGED